MPRRKRRPACAGGCGTSRRRPARRTIAAAPRTRSPTPRRRCSTPRRRWTRPRSQWRASGAPAAALTSARAALARAQDELAKRQAQLRGIDAPLPTPNEAQVASARGDLAFARVNLEKLKIRAPIDGTVLQLNINPGELAAPSALQPLLLIANLSTLNVRAELDERDVAEIKIGQAGHRSAPRRFPARNSPAR